MPGVAPTEFGGIAPRLGVDLPAAKAAAMSAGPAKELVLELACWFLMAAAKVIMRVDDDAIPDRDRAIIRRFWLQRKTSVRVSNDHGFIVLRPSEEFGVQLIDFELLSS